MLRHLIHFIYYETLHVYSNRKYKSLKCGIRGEAIAQSAEQWSRNPVTRVRNQGDAHLPFGKALILITRSLGEDLKQSAVWSLTYKHLCFLSSQVKEPPPPNQSDKQYQDKLVINCHHVTRFFLSLADHIDVTMCWSMWDGFISRPCGQLQESSTSPVQVPMSKLPGPHLDHESCSSPLPG